MQLTRLMNQLARLTAVFAVFFALGVEHLPAQIRAPRAASAPKRPARQPGLINPSQMVMTPQGAMHRSAAARLGLPTTPFPTGTGGGNQDPNARR
jgi:hypothetical protein